MQIKCLDQDLRVPDLRLHQLSTNGDFLKESTADQTCLIDEREILEKRYRGKLADSWELLLLLSLKIDRFSYAES